MSTMSDRIAASHGILQAVEAITNCRAFLTCIGTLLLGVLVSATLAYVGVQLGGGIMTILLGIVGFLIIAAIFLIGFSATGFLVNDQMRGRESRSIDDALVAALVTLPRLIGVTILISLIGLAVGLSIVAALFICKIPFLGPILYVAVFPLAVLLIAACWYASIFVAGLAAPAIWEGNDIMRTLGLLWAIIRTRLLVVVIHTLLLGLLVGVVAGLVFGAVMLGSMFTMGLSAAILPVYGASGGMFGGISQMAMGGALSGSGYMVAIGIGGGVIIACAAVIPCLVAIAGNCIIFANVSEGLSIEHYEEKISSAVDSVKQKASATRQQLEDQRQQSQSAPAAAAALACPQCKGEIKSDDVFCGNCGYKMNQ